MIKLLTETPSVGQEALRLYLLAFGSAAVKASLPSHGADQFDETDPKEARKMSTFFIAILFAVCTVYVAAIRNRNLFLPEDPAELFEIEQDKDAAEEVEFLSKKLFKVLRQSRPSPWKLCRVTQVENAKIVLSMIPVFCCTIIVTLCLAQLQTFSVQQGYTMDFTFTKHFHIPAASLQSSQLCS